MLASYSSTTPNRQIMLSEIENARGWQCRQAMRTRLCGGLPADLSFCYFLVKQKVEKENMNGRLYDPVIGRFFSPDNIVQLPEFSQSFNRYSSCLNNPLKYTDPSGQTWYDVRGERRFIDDGVDDDMAIKVSQMQFRRLERKFENDRNYEAYRDKLADINGYTTTHTIFGKFSEFSRNGNGTEVLPGVEVRWHRQNGIPYSDRQILGQWSESKPTETMLNGNIYVVHHSTEKYINLTDKSLKSEFDSQFRKQNKNMGPYFSPVADKRFLPYFIIDVGTPFWIALPLRNSIQEAKEYHNSLYYEKLILYYREYNIIK